MTRAHAKRKQRASAVEAHLIPPPPTSSSPDDIIHDVMVAGSLGASICFILTRKTQETEKKFKTTNKNTNIKISEDNKHLQTHKQRNVSL